jgi:hypothetical protein
VCERIQQRQLHDGALLIDVDARLEDIVAAWTPLRHAGSSASAPPAARVFVHQSELLGVEVPASPPSLRFGSVGLWLRPELGRCLLGSTERDCAGSVDLGVLQATLVTNGASGAAPRLQAMLTLASALLVARLGRALVHASGVVYPGGDAWLLVGAPGSGAAAAARLVAAGWGCMAVGRVVLWQDAPHGAILVEGWPGGESEGVAYQAAGPPAVSARLAGALILRAEPDLATRLLPGPASDLLGALVPSSPWLRLDLGAAAGTLRALRDGARTPLFELRLGLDTYANADRLSGLLSVLRDSSNRA